MMDEKNQYGTDDKFDIIEIMKVLVSGKRTVLFITIAAFLLGLFIALTTPTEFVARTILAPQLNNKNNNFSNLGNIAAIAGVNLTSFINQNNELSPILYPKIVNSIPFRLELLNEEIYWKSLGKKVTVLEYLNEYRKPSPTELLKKYTVRLPYTVWAFIRGEPNPNSDFEYLLGNEIINLSREERKGLDFFKNKILLVVDNQDGVIKLSVTANEAEVAAQLTRKAKMIFQKTLTEYKIDKAKQNLDFIETLYKEKKQNYMNAQKQFASFKDRNINMSTAVAMVEEERLYGNLEIAKSVYANLATQLEDARIKVTEDTPTFSVIEPVVVPNIPSKPNKILIIITSITIGLLMGIGFVFGKKSLSDFNVKWKAIRSINEK